MGSLRNKMITETLNYERGMNRIILDRTVEQAKLFNETRNPPSNRDIKFEALIGDIVNKLKETINQTTQAIKATQYTDMNAKEFIASIAKPDGTHPANDSVESGDEFDDFSESESESGGDSPGDADLPGEPPLAEAPPPVAGPKLKAAGRKLKSQKAVPNRNKRVGRGEESDEAEQGSENSEEEGLQQLKSDKQIIDKVENGVMTIVSEYNGLVSKILEATQPQGKFATKSSVTQTNIQFLGSILRDLEQPFKQLAFELSSSEFPEVTKYFNLVDNLVKIVQSSPPFQKVNFDTYKKAKINFQGMDAALVVDEDAYGEKLTKFYNRLRFSLTKLVQQAKAFEYNQLSRRVSPAIIEAGKSELNMQISDISATINKVEEELDKLMSGVKPTSEQKANALRALQREVEAAETALLPGGVILSKLAVDEANPSYKVPGYNPLPSPLSNAPVTVAPIPGEALAAAPSRFADRGDAIRSAPTRAAPARLPSTLPPSVGVNSVAEFMSIADVGSMSEAEVAMILRRIYGRDGMSRIREKGIDLRQLAFDLTTGKIDADDFSESLYAEPAEEELPVNAPPPFRASRTPKQSFSNAPPPFRASRTRKEDIPTMADINATIAEEDKFPEPAFVPPAAGGDALDAMDFPKLKAYAKAKIPTISFGRAPGPNGERMGPKSMAEIKAEVRAAGLNGSGRKKKCKGGSGGLADLLSTQEQQQHTRMGRPVSDEQAVQAEMIALAKRFQELSNPIHSTNVGLLYPFYEKDEASKYVFPMLLKHENGKKYPVKNALGADLSLLQGKIGGPTVYPKQPKKPATRKVVTQAEATQNIIEGRGRKKNPKALHKLKFNDEKNEMFD
jgi:hypothetical protein